MIFWLFFGVLGFVGFLLGKIRYKLSLYSLAYVKVQTASYTREHADFTLQMEQHAGNKKDESL